MSEPAVHVVLSISVGRFLAPLEGPRLIRVGRNCRPKNQLFVPWPPNIFPYSAYCPRKSRTAWDSAYRMELPPVLLHLKKMAGEWGMAKALLQYRARHHPLQLMSAVGVDTLAAKRAGTHYLASFRNYLDASACGRSIGILAQDFAMNSSFATAHRPLTRNGFGKGL